MNTAHKDVLHAFFKGIPGEEAMVQWCLGWGAQLRIAQQKRDIQIVLQHPNRKVGQEIAQAMRERG